MTKKEATEAGTAAGHDAFRLMTTSIANAMGEPHLVMRPEAERPEAEILAGLVASAKMADIGLRSAFYLDAFKAAFVADWQSAHDEIPEVKLKRRNRSIDWMLEASTRTNAEELEKFALRLSENPKAAFEWAEGAMRAAAERYVVNRIAQIINHPAGGYDAAIKMAIDETLRGANYPSHSTNAVSNVMAEATTAAWANFARSFGGF